MSNNGVFPDMSRETYDGLQRVNWSSLKGLIRSPAHYLHGTQKRDKDTNPRKLGRCTHLATLEPELFKTQCAVWDDGRRFGKKWDAFQDAHAGLEILTAEEYERCVDIQTAVRSNATAMKHLSGGRSEVSVLWTHHADGVGGLDGYAMELKGRVDFLSAGAIVDLKSTRDASPDGFAKEVYRYRYHTQAAIYSDGVLAATGKELPYLIVAVESEAPHVVQVYRVPDEILDVGREEYRALLDRLNYCRKTNAWPGYADGEMDLTLPRWAVNFSEGEDLGDVGLTIGNEGVSI